MINFLKRSLGLFSLEEKVEKYVQLQEDFNLVKSDIDSLARSFARQNNKFKKSLQLEENQPIVNEIKKKHIVYTIDHIDEISKAKDKFTSINSEINAMEYTNTQLLSAVNEYRAIEAFGIVKGKYKEGKISLDVYNNIIKAKKGIVKYADMIVFDTSGKVLFVQRTSDTDFEPNKWGLAGGHVDFSEDFDTAAKRELQEETGIEVKKCEKVGEYKDSKSHIEYHSTTINEEEPIVVLESSEHSNYKWMYLDDFLSDDEMEGIMNFKDNLEEIYFPVNKSIKVIKKAVEDGILSKDILEKAKSGIYTNTSENRKKGRVGNRYGKVKDDIDDIFKDKSTLNKYVKSTLNNFYDDYFGGLKPKEIEIKYYDGGLEHSASVGFGLKEDENGTFVHYKDGKPVKMSKDEGKVELSISNRVFGVGADKKKFQTTLTHEFAHIAQYNFLTKDELSDLRKVKVKSNKMSSYTPNLLEAQAEAVAINELGSSSHSYKNAKESDEYKTFLDSYMYIIESGFDFNINELLEKVDKYIVKDNIKKAEKISGGVADGKTAKDLEEKYNITNKQVKQLLLQGIEVELEHTDDKKVAAEIAIDHLWEDQDYYDKLKEVEKAEIRDLFQSTENILEKARSGIYANTSENKKKGRVGQKYGGTSKKYISDEDKSIVSLLDDFKGVKVQEAGTGTLYLKHRDKKIRIADHEPNFNAKRDTDYKELYTQDSTPANLVYEVAEEFGLKIPEKLQGRLDAIAKEEDEIRVAQNKVVEKENKEAEEYKKEKSDKLSQVKSIILDNKEDFLKIIKDTEAYGDLGSNSTKRNKRRRSYFRNAVKEKYNIDLELSDFKEVVSNSSLKKSESEDIQKGRSGVYADNAQNRKLKRVGQKYGSKGADTPKEGKTSSKEEETSKKPTGSVEEQAKEASGSSLETAAKEASDPEVRSAAHKELDRREKEEKVQPEEESKQNQEKEAIEADKRLDEIFDVLRDEYDMDDSPDGYLTKVVDKKWVTVDRNFKGLDSKSKKLVAEYYDLMGKDVEKAAEKSKQNQENKEPETQEEIEAEIKRLRDADIDYSDEKALNENLQQIKDLYSKRKELIDSEGGEAPTIQDKVEELSDKYKDLMKEGAEDDFSDEEKTEQNYLKQKEYSRYISRTKEWFDGIDKEEHIKAAQDLLGLKSEKEVQDFFGDGKVLGIQVEDEFVTVLTEDCFCQRGFGKNGTVDMIEFILNPDLDKGLGKGSSIFNNQVNTFKDKGYKKLTTDAAQSNIYNGYYTWARLGYEPTDSSKFNSLIESSNDKNINSVQSMAELMSFPKGREFWKKNGYAFKAEFALEDNAQSMFILNKYMEEKKNAKK